MLIAIALLGGLITFYLINAVMGGLRYNRPARIRISFASPADHELPYEDVSLRSSDGVKLAGWYIPSQNRAAVILFHGYSGNRLGVMSHAVMLAKAGFGILMIDLRAHGHSGGGGTFARGESLIGDARAAYNYLQGKEEVDKGRIGCLGVSLGGTIALQSAARIKGISVVISDGAGLAAFEDLLPPQGVMSWAFLPFNRLFFKIASRRTAVPPFPPNKETVSKIAPRPLFLIATGRGGEFHLNTRYLEAAHEPKRLWQIQDAAHAGGWQRRPQEYAENVVGFLSDHLLG